MRVLIGGEYSGTIRDAFIARGHDAMSCDLSPTTVPGPHHQGDWWEVMHDGWDLGIFHPTCTYMANSGAKHLFNDMNKASGLNRERWVALGEAAWAVWDLIERCPIKRIAIEITRTHLGMLLQSKRLDRLAKADPSIPRR